MKFDDRISNTHVSLFAYNLTPVIQREVEENTYVSSWLTQARRISDKSRITKELINMFTTMFPSWSYIFKVKPS